MLARNPMRLDYQRKYEDIVADYNREKDRATIEETFRQLVELVNSLDEEQTRAAREGLSEDEQALDWTGRRASASNRRAANFWRRLGCNWPGWIAFGRKSRPRPMSRYSFSTRFSPDCRRRRSPQRKRRFSRPTCTRMFGSSRWPANLRSRCDCLSTAAAVLVSRLLSSYFRQSRADRSDLAPAVLLKRIHF
jgi:hypothetical protein